MPGTVEPTPDDLLGSALDLLVNSLLRLCVLVLNPGHALFGETDYLLREDPRITDRALYLLVLAAISAGDTAPGRYRRVAGARRAWSVACRS